MYNVHSPKLEQTVTNSCTRPWKLLKTICRQVGVGAKFGSKFYKPLQVWGFIRKQSLHKAFLLFREQRGFKGDFSFFVIKKRNTPLTPKRKNILLTVLYSLTECKKSILPCGTNRGSYCLQSVEVSPKKEILKRVRNDKNDKERMNHR